MKKIQFKLEYNEEKVKAIKVSLKDKGKEFDGEIIKLLDKLYNKNVPKLLKEYIEADFKEEDKIGNKTKDKIKETDKEVPKEEKLSSKALDNNDRKY